MLSHHTEPLGQRILVWELLSELWLDNELGASELSYLAEQLAQSPFSIEQLRHIHYSELAPVLASNLSLYGSWIWTGFDRGWLIQQCLQSFRNRNRTMFKLKRKLLMPYYRSLSETLLASLLQQVEQLRKARY